jgi:hypothetical protein
MHCHARTHGARSRHPTTNLVKGVEVLQVVVDVAPDFEAPSTARFWTQEGLVCHVLGLLMDDLNNTGFAAVGTQKRPTRHATTLARIK